MSLRLLLLAFLCCIPALPAADPPVAPPVVAPVSKPRLGVILDEAALDPSQGVPVRGVAPGSSAVALGIQAGDLLSSFNGKAIRSSSDLLAALGETKIGDQVTVEVVRAGTKQSLTGKLIPPATSASLQQELNAVRAELAELQADATARTREPTLAELIRELHLLQEQIPRAAAEFKKIYPDGEFSIIIRVTSDKHALNPVDLLQLTEPKPPEPADK